MKNYVEKSSDLNIRGVLLYVKTVADGYVYVDSAKTIKADAKTLTHAFQMNNAVIVDGDNEYRPIFLTDVTAETYVSLTYIKIVETVATATVVHSSEYISG